MLEKKWVYGNPDAIEISSEDWFRWLRFINIIVFDNRVPRTIHTYWEDDSLYGYSTLPNNTPPLADIKEAAVAEEWRIERHQDLIPVAKRVCIYLEAIEDKQRESAEAILQILSY